MTQAETKQRFYTVMCDSTRKPGDYLARVSPLYAGDGHFWTGTDVEQVWKMDRETAEEILFKLHHNAPRLVRYEKAIAQITAQHDRDAGPALGMTVDVGPGL